MAQNIGTLVTSAIRPNDSNDPIASAFASEIKGGIHSVTTISDRNNIIVERRDWGMLCYVADEDKTYQLKYNYVSTDITNNNNWVEFSGSGGIGNSEWLDSVLSIEFEPPATYSTNDRYLAGTSQNDSLLGNWSGFTPGSILEWNSIDWIPTEPTNGTSVRVDNEDNAIYRYEGTFPTGQWNEEKLGQVRSIDATSSDAETYTAETSPSFDNYVRDMVFLTKFDTVNAGATVSININSMGFVDIKKPSSSGLIDLVTGDIVPDITYSLVYNGSVFELVKHYTGGDNALNIKYYIESGEHVVIPPFHQYWVYGNLTLDGEITNYGQIIIANGNLINSGNLYNDNGELYFIEFEAGIGPLEPTLSAGLGITISNSEVSVNTSTQSGLTFSQDDELVINTDSETIKINQGNQLYVSGNSIYEWNYSDVTLGSEQPTGVTISNTPLNYSTVKVMVNGQVQVLGGTSSYTTSDCYFFDGSVVKDIDNINVGDELYWNGGVASYDLSPDDKILFIYEI